VAGGLKTVPQSVGQLPLLKELLLKHCSSLEHLPNTFGQLVKLRQLLLTGCSSLQSLPASLWHLPALQVLHVQQCSTLSSFPTNSGDLDVDVVQHSTASLRYKQLLHDYLADKPLSGMQQLLELRIENCEQLQNLPASKGQLSALTALYIQLVLIPVGVTVCAALHERAG
jgi:hypothetical protein